MVDLRTGLATFRPLRLREHTFARPAHARNHLRKDPFTPAVLARSPPRTSDRRLSTRDPIFRIFFELVHDYQRHDHTPASFVGSGAAADGGAHPAETRKSRDRQGRAGEGATVGAGGLPVRGKATFFGPAATRSTPSPGSRSKSSNMSSPRARGDRPADRLGARSPRKAARCPDPEGATASPHVHVADATVRGSARSAAA